MRNGAIRCSVALPGLSLVKAVAGYSLRDGCPSADQRDVLSQCANLICWMSGIGFNTATQGRKTTANRIQRLITACCIKYLFCLGIDMQHGTFRQSDYWLKMCGLQVCPGSWQHSDGLGSGNWERNTETTDLFGVSTVRTINTCSVKKAVDGKYTSKHRLTIC